MKITPSKYRPGYSEMHLHIHGTNYIIEVNSEEIEQLKNMIAVPNKVELSHIKNKLQTLHQDYIDRRLAIIADKEKWITVLDIHGSQLYHQPSTDRCVIGGLASAPKLYYENIDELTNKVTSSIRYYCNPNKDPDLFCEINSNSIFWPQLQFYAELLLLL